MTYLVKTATAVALIATSSLASPVASASTTFALPQANQAALGNTMPSDPNYIPHFNRKSVFQEERSNRRLYDSRESHNKILSAYQTRVVSIDARKRAGEEAASYVLNVTAINPENDGFLTVWSGGGARPNTSSVNYKRGQIIANQVHVKAPAAEEPENTDVSVYSHATTHFIIDVVGYYDKYSQHYVPVDSRRVHDSRDPKSSLAVNRVTTVKPLDASIDKNNVEAVVTNVTIVGKGNPGYATVWPEGTRPTASSVNFTGDALISNQVMTKIAADGTFKVYTSADAEVIVDVVGYILKDKGIKLHQPIRILDERDTSKHCCHRIKSDLIRVQVEQRKEDPKWGKAYAIVNLTVVGATKPGYISARATGFRDFNEVPLGAETSTQNYKSGTIRAGMAIVPVSEQGIIEVYRHGDAKLVVDLVGYVAKGEPRSRPGKILGTSALKVMPEPTKVRDGSKLSILIPKGWKLGTSVTIGQYGNWLSLNGPSPESSYTVDGDYLTIQSAALKDHKYVDVNLVTTTARTPYSDVPLKLRVPFQKVADESAPGVAYPTTNRPTVMQEMSYDDGVRLAEPAKFNFGWPLADGTKVVVSPESPYSKIPNEEFKFTISADRTQVHAVMPAPSVVRKYLGEFGGVPENITVQATNKFGDLVKVKSRQMDEPE